MEFDFGTHPQMIWRQWLRCTAIGHLKTQPAGLLPTQPTTCYADLDLISLLQQI